MSAQQIYADRLQQARATLEALARDWLAECGIRVRFAAELGTKAARKGVSDVD